MIFIRNDLLDESVKSSRVDFGAEDRVAQVLENKGHRKSRGISIEGPDRYERAQETANWTVGLQGKTVLEFVLGLIPLLLPAA